MKNIYLNYNEIIDNYTLSEGKTYDNKRLISKIKRKDLASKLRDLDLNRKTDIFLKEIPKEDLSIIESVLIGTKFNIKYLEPKSKAKH